MPAFITQTVEEQITWLVVCSDESHPLLQPVVELLQQNGFLVETNTALPRNTESYYKIILIYQSIIQIQPSLAVGTISRPTLLLTTSASNDVGFQTQVESLSLKKPGMSWCLGLDVVEAKPSLEWQKLIISRLDQGMLVDPQLTTHAQTAREFVQRSGELLLAPWSGQKWLVVGKPVSSSKLVLGLKNTAYRVLNKSFKVVLSSTHLSSPGLWSAGWVTKTHQTEVVESINAMLGWLQSSVKKQPAVGGEIPQGGLSKPPSPPRATPPQPQPPTTPTHNQSQKPSVFTPSTLARTPSAKQSQTPSTSPRVVVDAAKSTPPPPKPDPQKQITAELQKLFEVTQVEHQVERVTQVAKQSKTIHHHQKKRKIAFFVGAVVSGIGMGLLTLMGVLLSSTWVLKHQLLLVTQNLQQTESKNFQEYSSNLKFWETLVAAQLKTYQLVLGDEFFSHPLALIEVSQQLLGVGDLVQSGRGLTQRAVLQMLGSDTGDALTTLNTATTKAAQAYQQLSLLDAALDQWSSLNLPQEQLINIEQFVQLVATERRALTTTQQLQPLLPQLLGVNRERHYAVLLTDNQELTPGGGYVAAVAVITFHQGLMVNSQVYSTNQLNSRILGDVLPPTELTTQLGSNPYQTQDVSLFSNFSTTGEQTRWFLEKTLGQQIDGVVSIDLLGLSHLIAALGPVEVSQYNETITNHNLADRAEFHSEVPLTEQNQPTYLGVVLEAVLKSLRLSPQEKTSSVLSALNRGLQEQHVLVYLHDSGEQASFEALGWAGRVLDPGCPNQLVQESQEVCRVDAIYQLETNLGANKANHHVERSVTHTVKLTNTAAQHTRDVVWTNSATSNAWPKGQYTALLEFVLPSEATSPALKINDQKLPPNQVTISTSNGRSVVSAKLAVPVQTTTHAHLTFETPLPDSPEFAYAVFDQKQPGTDQDPNTIVFEFTPELTNTLVAPQATLLDNSIAFTDFKDRHLFVGAVFSKH